MKRRKFLSYSSLAMMGLLINKEMFASIHKQTDDDIREYLKKIIYSKEEIDDWFAGRAFPFSKYDSQLGWLLNNNSFQDGINKSWSVYTYKGIDGERIMTNYADKRCRINTYGNSYTQCHQVSDHETWQENLAAHLQEPVKNFGIGGWSVYQAYLRMLKEENRTPSKYIIFNIYEDDHLRNLDSWRNIRVKKVPQHIESTLPYIKADMKNDKIYQRRNPCPTRDSFYQLCNLEKTYELFKDDFVLKIMIEHEKSRQKNGDKNYESLNKLTQTHGIETRLNSEATISEAADNLHREVALFSSKNLVMKILDYAKAQNKTVLFVLSYPAMYHAKYFEEVNRWDQSFIDFLAKNNFPFIDLHKVHKNEWQQTKLAARDYLSKYYIGHYNPLGNFFCAQAIRDKIIEMLEPKPLPYLRR